MVIYLSFSFQLYKFHPFAFMIKNAGERDYTDTPGKRFPQYNPTSVHLKLHSNASNASMIK